MTEQEIKEYEYNFKRDVLRLFGEWKLHGKIIIPTDFDDTICPWKFNDQKACDKIIELLVDCINVGAYVIIHTACNPDRFKDIEGYCKKKGLNISEINNNPINLPYGNHKKPYGNWFIDDRAGLFYATKVLAEAMYMMRAKQWSERLDYPGASGF